MVSHPAKETPERSPFRRVRKTLNTLSLLQIDSGIEVQTFGEQLFTFRS